MPSRAVIGVVFTCILMTAAWSGAHAQQPTSAGQVNPTGWIFNIAPYLWLPTAHVTLQYDLPPALGGRLPTEGSSGPGDYLSHLDFALAFAADARNGPFSLLTDFMFTRFSATNSHINSLDFFGLPSMPIARSLQTSVGTTLSATIWSLAGGYTVLQGQWGNLDLIAGLRLLAVNATTDFSLALMVSGPRGNGATFGGIGGVSGSQNIWNGIGGFRGRIRLGDTHLFIPYYFDIGAGGSQLTWQIASGVGYQIKWAAISATYRYLSFEQGSGAVVKNLSLGGPMLMVNFSF
jgi:hypothetical protein